MAMTLVTFLLGVTMAVLVAGSASAALPPTNTTTTTTTAATTTSATTPDSPAARYFVINGTANATSAHVIGGSSAFPNFKTGAIDNSYSMAHAHVDNSPFAQGTGSPADTGPVGQTVAAGHFQQPQYADARWPGDTGKATYGKRGEPYAAASASEYRATAEASEAAQGLSGPSGSSPMAVPKGLDGRLRQALAAWKADWAGRLAPKKPAAPVPTPRTPAVTTPTVTVGGAKTKPPVPVPTVPPPPVPSPPVPPPPVPAPTVPAPPVPTLPSGSSSAPSRSLASVTSSPAPSRSPASASASRDGAYLLESSTLATLDPKTNALVTSGESSLGRVSLGGGQIVIEDIHVSASITNDGAPTHKVAVSVGAAKIGGVPVTIDQDGVHIAGQRQGVPYEQASSALNGALKQAGIQLFLVGPEITTNECDPTGTDTSDQSGTGATADSCDQAGATDACDQTGTDTDTTTTTTAPTPIPTSTTTSDQSDTTTTTSSCNRDFAPPTTTSSCEPTGTGTGTTTTSASSSDQTGTGTGTTNSGGMTITAAGLHVKFTQPARQAGVPAQHAEYILGEVFLDSLAVPAGSLPKLDLSSSSSSLSSSACLGAGHSSGTTSGGALTAGGSLSAGGSTSSGTLSPSASTFGSTSQPTSGSTGTSLPAAFAAALRKPLWLLLAYVLWQAIVIGTGVSVWNWRRGEAS